jgi:hypothetical protein
LDLKAKSPVQYFIGDNGYFGCSFCIQAGEHSNHHYFPYHSSELFYLIY